MSKLTESIRSWKTTLIGFVPLILSILIMTGIINPGHQEAVIDGVKVVLDNAEAGINAVLALVSGVVGLLGIFSKDGDK